MSKFNRRSWLENRFKGLYPGVLVDLRSWSLDYLEEVVPQLDTQVTKREGLNLDVGRDRQRLADMIGDFKLEGYQRKAEVDRLRYLEEEEFKRQCDDTKNEEIKNDQA